MSDKKKRNRKIIIAGVLVIIPVVVIAILIFPIYYSTIHPNRLFVEYSTDYLIDDTLRFRCALGLDSANALKRYDYSIEDNKLYIIVKGGLVSGGYGSEIDVVIKDDRISDITAVYARGGGETKLLLSIGDDNIVNETLNPDFDPDYTVVEAIPIE
jgi:hypothetical protein